MAIARIGILVTTSFSLRTIGRMFTGPLDPRWAHLQDMRGLHLVAAVPLIALIVLIGVFPSPVLNLINSTVTPMIAGITK